MAASSIKVVTLDYRRAFGKQLRQWRRSERLKQSDIAKKLGVSQASFTNWERGRSLPSDSSLAALKEIGLVISEHPVGSAGGVTHVLSEAAKYAEVLNAQAGPSVWLEVHPNCLVIEMRHGSQTFSHPVHWAVVGKSDLAALKAHMDEAVSFVSGFVAQWDAKEAERAKVFRS